MTLSNARNAPADTAHLDLNESRHQWHRFGMRRPPIAFGHDEDIGMPQMALEEAGDEGSDDAAGPGDANWQRHETNLFGCAPTKRTKKKGALPLWLQPQTSAALSFYNCGKSAQTRFRDFLLL